MKARSTLPTAPAADDARYQIERKLGEGGAGAVYLVRDRETGEQLALKKLFRMDAKSVLRLKREFRSLQAVNHPHLIKLYDMGQASDSWFLTMEYLDGADLTAYLGAAANSANAGPAATSLPGGPRLLPAFQQLARGIQALHDAGMLHRDLKPSNVLVVDHRVVVLDFGLVRELGQQSTTLTEDGSVAGTPAYMAPEQLAANELTAASDWYAFGAMLYEALSGLLPIDGPMLQLLRAKLESDPVPLEQLVPEVPRWLSDLCMELLRRDPAQRPTGQDVLARLVALPPTAAIPPTNTDTLLRTESGAQGARRQLFGRATETKRLWAALAEAEAGRAVAAHIRGVSGTGKSALVEHFLDEVELSGSVSNSAAALVLRSRCYELEAMPFKALDGVMDALVRYLSRLDDLDVAYLLPADVSALACVFPVLERLPAVKRLVSKSKPIHDALQSRRRAEIALRTLLENLAARTPLVLWVDDLHWGDLDSARILKDWIMQPSAAPILYLFSYRSDEATTSPCLRTLLSEDNVSAVATHTHTLDIAPLRAEDIRALCEPHLGAQTPGRAELIARVVREADGSPFLASQLIALAEAKSARGDADLHTLSLDLMVAQTSALLAEDAQQLLAVLAVAGRPMPPKCALEAAGVRRGGRALVHDLRGLNLVRSRDVGGERRLEVYHDRVRERVQSSLSVEQRQQIHASLFEALESSGQAEPDWLYTLALGAGQTERALRYARAAAERANGSLAFERAAGLYRKCIELVPTGDSGELWSKLSLASARCGRGVDAAEAALAAAQHAAPAERVDWIQRAASHFLRSGHFVQGEALVREVLDARRIHAPTSKPGLTAAIAWERTRIKMHGTKDTLRSGQAPAAELLERIDVLASLSLNTAAYDPLRATLFQARALRCALEAGEPRRLMQALCSASFYACSYASAQAVRESDALMARATAINAQLPTPDFKVLCAARAVNAYVLGRMDEVLEAAREADVMFRSDSQDDPIGNYHRRVSIASMRIRALQHYAEYSQCAGELHSLLEEATATGNRSLLLQLTYCQTLAEQVEGRAAKSGPRLETQRRDLPDDCFGPLHVLHMFAVMSDVCWTGQYTATSDYLNDVWERFTRSPLRLTAHYALLAHHRHAQLVLNRYVATGRSKGDPTQLVDVDILALEKLTLSSAAGAAQRCRARAAFLKGDREVAAAQLRKSAATHQAAGMAHEAARDQFALGCVLGGNDRTVLCSAAEQRIRDLGVVDVPADLRAHYPELIEAG